MRFAALTILLTSALCAQNKTPDLCAPPPSSFAPTLPAHLMTGQGDIHFQITTKSKDAQKFFDQGVSQMHSFWAFEAERSFRQAAELDPTAPMPQWGIAMVAAGDYRPRFQLDTNEKNFGKSRANQRAADAARLADQLAKVPGKATPLEKLYIASILARRDPNSKDPDEAYIRGLRAIAAQYPNQVEAKSYLALHLMRGFELPGHQPKGTSMEAVAILRELLVQFPNHPGVHHYVIHAWEGSSFAKEAWPSCQRYASWFPTSRTRSTCPGIFIPKPDAGRTP